MEVEEIAHKIALLNALRHGGKAQPKPVLGKLLGKCPHLRDRIKETTSIINDVVREVNKLPLEKQRRIVDEKWPEILISEKIEGDKILPPLSNVEKYELVVTRFSPNPDFVLHLGSARAIILSHEYARMYKGRFYLRFEDTDPKMKKPMLQFYDLIRRDVTWLGCRWDTEFVQSDRLPIYYDHARRILERGHAYVCTCGRKDFQEKARTRESCSCRDLTPNENLLRWNHMLNGTYGEGKAVVRIKTDMNHPNPAVRDWPALRIIDTTKYPHPRVGSKYRVWPLYNFACGIDDHLMAITHVIRGKEHLTNQTRQEYMYDHFGWKYPEAIHYGRLKITGTSLSKSVILQGFRNGFYEHWDDPRLATLAALRRRGITSQAIRRLMMDVGPKTADVVLSWKNLYAHNRKIVDPTANRYFFVHDPKKLTVKNIPRTFAVQVPLHPGHPEKGFRSFKIAPHKKEASFLVSNDDLNILKKKRRIRFMELFNFQVEKVEKNLIKAIFYSESYEEAKKIGAPLIHWIPVDSGIPCEVVMPDASTAKGIAEEACKELTPDKIIQFERFGFVRVDKVKYKLTAHFAHR